jgi:glycosyltransferase involved in cell wall biosynthesis
MTLSIITVNLNNRDGLQKTIDSVIGQTFRDFEWIVIDGGSTDGSKELIEQYVNHFAYWVSEPDKGIYNAMNKGIGVAKGEYLLFLNSGDYLFNNITLERCFSHNFEADIVYGNLFFCRGNTMEPFHYPQKLNFKYLYKKSLGHPATFIKRDILKESLYDETLKIASDWKFFLTQVLENKSFEHIEEYVSCFDTHGISSTNWMLVDAERRKVLSEEINPVIIEDYKTMDRMEEQLNQIHVKKILIYGHKKKIYHKMITACLWLIELLDKCYGKRESLNHSTLL